MNKTVLITGGGGFIGKPLTTALLKRGYAVNHLSREPAKATPGVKTFKWDLEAGTMDERALENVGVIIHLAGEGIIARPWSAGQKEKIIKSRTDSIKLIYKYIKEKPSHNVKTVLSASGVGYYGNRDNELLYEENQAGKDFMAETCILWEAAADEGTLLGIRVVKLRTGIVLSKKGGALTTLAFPVKIGLGAALGSGKQWAPWIHLKDMVNMYLFAIENEKLSGAYNASAPYPVTNKELTSAIARATKKRLWLPAVPAFALRGILGEMSAVILNSTRTSSEKIQAEGFEFLFEKLPEALQQIYGKQNKS